MTRRDAPMGMAAWRVIRSMNAAAPVGLAGRVMEPWRSIHAELVEDSGGVRGELRHRGRQAAFRRTS
jgi:hypothetical protein